MLTASRWVPLITTMITGPSVPVSPLMTAQFRLRIVLSPFGRDRFWLSAGTTYAFNKDASVDVGVSYMHGQSVKINEGPYQFESEGKARLFGTNFNYAF